MQKNRKNLIENKKMTFGKSLKEFIVGSKIIHWPGKTITESDNNIFSLITMNHHPLHIDKIFAKKQKHKKVVINGTLVFSLVVGMTVKDISGKAIANLEYKSVKHLAPTFIGDTLYVSTKVINARESETKRNTGVVTVKSYVMNQDDTLVLTFERIMLVPKKHNI